MQSPRQRWRLFIRLQPLSLALARPLLSLRLHSKHLRFERIQAECGLSQTMINISVATCKAARTDTTDQFEMSMMSSDQRLRRQHKSGFMRCLTR